VDDELGGAPAKLSFLNLLFISDNGSPIGEVHSSNYLSQALESPELDSVLLGAQPHQEHHLDFGVPGDTSPGLGRPETHGSKGRFYCIGGSDMDPMLCREVIESQQRISVFVKTVGEI